MPESESESGASGAGSGGSMPEPLASYDPATSSWRTSQLSLDGGLTEFSETWPRSGTMRSGMCYRLLTLGRRTSASDSGLWPTPNVPNGGRSVQHVTEWRGRTAYHNGVKVQVGLEAAVKMWPTPTAGGFEVADIPNLLARRERLAKKYGNNGFGLTLNQAVKLWPTPQAHDASKGYAERVGRYGTEHGARNLNDEAVASTGQATGSLNPTWVEWLMGYPLGWTDLGDSATPSSPSAPVKARLRGSRKGKPR